MRKFIASITAGLISVLFLTTIASAIQFSPENKDIEIVYGEFTGYRFNGPEAPVGVNTSQIAKVKFYIKCPDLETIEEAVVQLVFNSGSTGWVETEHDLNDGLIVEVEVDGVVEGDFFDAALGTWNEEVWGTFSVELLNSAGGVIGTPVYPDNEPEVTETEPEFTTSELMKDGVNTEETSEEMTEEMTEESIEETMPEFTEHETTETHHEMTEPEETVAPKDGTFAPVTTTMFETVAGAQDNETNTTETVTETMSEEEVTTVPTTEATTAETSPHSSAAIQGGNETAPKTGSTHIATAIIITTLSAVTIATTRKKRNP
ncbi:MAG: hypothetical protein FWG83_00340 [Oscillospiraceae bacterium]|nr:hypothetical protein [Oscillospiraceae bacterium]